MKHSYLKTTILSTAFILMICISIAHAKAPQPVVIVAEKSGNKTIYTVNSIRTTLPQMIDRIEAEDIRSSKAFIIAQDTISLGEINNLTGLIQKIGISNIRYFTYGNDRRHMREFKYIGKSIPFSNDPSVLSKIK